MKKIGLVKSLGIFSLVLLGLNGVGCKAVELGFEKTKFKSVLIRGSAPTPRVAGNSLEGIRASQTQGYRHIEVDFHISKDDVLVTAHDDPTRGCGKVSQKNAAELQSCALSNKTHMTSLSKVLSLDFDTVMLDLKTAKNATFERTVDAAILAIKKAKADDRVIVFVYGTQDRIIEKLRKASIPFGYKGYPKTKTRQLFYDAAAKMKAQYICVKASGVAVDDVAPLLAAGISIVGWEDSKQARVEHVRALKKVGMSGLISSEPSLFLD